MDKVEPNVILPAWVEGRSDWAFKIEFTWGGTVWIPRSQVVSHDKESVVVTGWLQRRRFIEANAVKVRKETCDP